MSRALAKAGAGAYEPPAMLGFAGRQDAVMDIALSNGGYGPCGLPDEFGRCGSTYHQPGCAHGRAVDWLASGPPRATYEASLANALSAVELAAPAAVWDDPDDPGDAPAAIPQQTLELAHSLADAWGLDDAVAAFTAGPSYEDLLRPPPGALDPYEELAGQAGYGSPPQQAPSYPGVHELAGELGLA
jgi:hypothetical protein